MNDKDKYVVLAKRTHFGNTGEMSFGFITEYLLLIMRKDRYGGREHFDLKSFENGLMLFPDFERIRFFRTQETAQNFCDTHELELDGEKLELVAVRYGSLFRSVLE